MNSCKKFGVTFHKNMDLKTLIAQWNKVAPDVKKANPEMNALMTTGQTLLDSQNIARQAAVTAQESLNTITEVVTAASATLTGNITYAATEAESIAAKEAENAQDALVQAQTESIFGQLC